MAYTSIPTIIPIAPICLKFATPIYIPAPFLPSLIPTPISYHPPAHIPQDHTHALCPRPGVAGVENILRKKGIKDMSGEETEEGGTLSFCSRRGEGKERVIYVRRIMYSFPEFLYRVTLPVMNF